MANKKLTHVDKAINKSILLIITIIWGLVTVFAFASNYVAGICASVVLYILVHTLISADQIEKWLHRNVAEKKWTDSKKKKSH